jgi:hypothetical protein
MEHARLRKPALSQGENTLSGERALLASGAERSPLLQQHCTTSSCFHLRSCPCKPWGASNPAEQEAISAVLVRDLGPVTAI